MGAANSSLLLKFGCLGDPRIQVFGITASVEPIGNVALPRAVRPMLGDIEDLYLFGDAGKGRADNLNMLVASVVIVTEDDDMRTTKKFAVFREPITGAARVRGRDQAKLTQIVHVFLAFADVDDAICCDACDKFG